jgi:DNA-binding beta-propeller fold protein YncE
VEQIKEMTTEFNADALAPCEVANIGFVTLPSFSGDCGQVGNAYVQVVAPEACYATGEGLEVAVVNERATASVYALDHHGKHFARNIKRMMCGLTSKIGTPIMIMTINGLNGPWGVVVNKKGEIIIVECDAHRVSVYSQAGEKLRSFGSRGSGEGHFEWPRGVAVDSDDNILVADALNHRIQKFTADGKFIIAMGSLGTKPLQFNRPTGIAVHPQNKLIYVSESFNCRVQILKPDLTFHKLFGSSGSDKGQFYQPRGIAFDSKQNVYVGEFRMNTHIQIFTQEGEHLRWLGDTKLNRPYDVCIDSNDIAYVCDMRNHRICIFDSSGTLLHSFGTKGKSPGQFNCPYGITIDKNGLLYVSDHYNGRVQIFCV